MSVFQEKVVSLSIVNHKLKKTNIENLHIFVSRNNNLFLHLLITVVILVCYEDLIKQMLANESNLGQSMKPYAERGVRSMNCRFFYIVYNQSLFEGRY